MRTTIRSWLARTDRFWDRLLGTGPADVSRKPRRMNVEHLEDRIVPDGRPLPFPVVAVGPGPGEAPLVRMFDLETGAPLLSLVPFGTSHTGGVRVAIADISQDGYPDVICSAGPGGGPHVKVYNGRTGAQLPGAIGSFFAFLPRLLVA